MKPKEYLRQLEKDVPRAIDDLDFAYRQGLYEGAKQMHKLIRGAQHRYTDANRDKVRAYNTQYQRERRAKIKAMREDIDKIASME